MLPVSLVQSACDIIKTARPILVNVVLLDLYQNTFWNARYEEDGFACARTEVQQHIQNLIASIQTGKVDAYAAYWAEYRARMVERGACTYHVHEAIACTACEVGLILRDGFPLAEPCFAAAHRALAYDHPACRALSDHCEDILERAMARLSPPEGKFKPYRRDLHYHLSYLEDAAVLDRPDLFRQHLDFVRPFLAEYGVRAADLAGSLQVLGEEIERALPAEFAALFTGLLRAATRA